MSVEPTTSQAHVLMMVGAEPDETSTGAGRAAPSPRRSGASSGRDRERERVPDAFWALRLAEAYRVAGSGPGGLTRREAAARLTRYGPNRIVARARSDTLTLLLRQFDSPLILILAFATILSGILGDATSATIILVIIGASGVLGFWQERGATRAVDALRSVVQVEAEVRRHGTTATIPAEEIVPGDVVLLNAGDVVPGDGLVIQARNLLTDESALTGEAFPVEKRPGVVRRDAPLTVRTNAVFLGTHVASGSGAALILRTGRDTAFGVISARLGSARVTTSFEHALEDFGRLLIWITAGLAIAIFAVNVVLSRPLIDSALFSLALAVGLTPQLLPAIVTISLSQGARLMARHRVIVKRLDAIEDFGAMTLLCTDKTGTMTEGTVRLEAALDLEGRDSPTVLRAAARNAGLQSGFTNPIDTAIVAAAGTPDHARAVDELPYDFSRRLLSVLVDVDGNHELITKGAVESVLRVCSDALGAGGRVAIGSVTDAIRDRFAALSAAGLRVLAVASREMDVRRLGPEDEAGLTFLGFLTFSDPPRAGVEHTIAELARTGIAIRMITGDNRLSAALVGERVGLANTRVMTGAEVASLDDGALTVQAAAVGIFAEVDPAQKERIIRAMRRNGEVVGYLGDGINDAPALHAADVGISVDTAVDVAKAAAAIVLLEKDLGVLLEGVRQGRRTFANTLKYIFTTISANFGNVLSLAIVAGILPFLPLLATQILLVNLLTDMPATTIATDRVDPELLDRSQSLTISRLRSFMIRFGTLSSAFDLITFATLRLAFGADEVLFRSGWFVESVATEIAVLLVLRTNRPFYRSRPSRLLIASTLAVGVATLAIIYGPAGVVGLAPLPLPMLATLLLITAAYVAATEVAKGAFHGFPAR